MNAKHASCCSGPDECCSPPALGRRDLLKLVGTTTAAMMFGESEAAVAGPFVADDFTSLVPADKKLTESWIRSLFERGEPDVYHGSELDHIGMPIGGLCCGQVYLGGDGRLWHWDVFHKHIVTRGQHYREPMSTDSPVDIGFTLRTDANEKRQVRRLDRSGFGTVTFRGAYPIGFVDYADDDCPVQVSLEAFSPFIPLDVDRSSYPATVMRYTLRNTSDSPVRCDLAGHLANPICLYTGQSGGGDRRNRIGQFPGAWYLHATAEEREPHVEHPIRSDIVYDDFESGTYEKWEVTGSAFGDRPIAAAQMPAYQGDVGAQGKQLVNSHNTRHGEDVGRGDAHTGTLTSQPFTIERRYIHFLIGGSHEGRTCLNLLVEGKVVRSQTGADNNRLTRHSFQVADLEGKQARLQIVDRETGSWGNIGVDHIVFSDTPAETVPPLTQRFDFGDMTLAVLDAPREPSGTSFGSAGLDAQAPDAGPFANAPEEAVAPLAEQLAGCVGRQVHLAPGQDATITFLVAWRFPNAPVPVGEGLYYANRFGSSRDVAAAIVEDFAELSRLTRLWHETWYDSTLPYWFLDRTFVNTSTLATSTCLQVGGGRFWGWEGVRCCPGTCLHVWHYAHSVGRVFPELERITREHVDFGSAFHEDGWIRYRGKFAPSEAIDGQCGTILRVLREHQMSPDDRFLHRIWPRVKKAITYVMTLDPQADGILEGRQYNTLDAAWYGEISWISSLYLAALRAGAAMARELKDEDFARRCEQIANRGMTQLTEELFNGEYYFQRRDPDHPDALGAGIGCHIDQVLGQSWAFQVGLPRVLPAAQTVKALQSLWRYNFTPDVGPYRDRFPTGRWFAMPGEGGLIMCTFPKGGERAARGGRPTHGFAGYFNECMNGFEYQAAGHMIAEGLVQEGLAVTRAIHDRYHPSRRNPYNEIECGDHYARSMASYGVYVTACGFEYHGPRGVIGFNPKLSSDDFRAAFIAAEGWGTFAQRKEDGRCVFLLSLKHGELNLKTVHLTEPSQDSLANRSAAAEVSLDGTAVAADVRPRDSGGVVVALNQTLRLQSGQQLEIVL